MSNNQKFFCEVYKEAVCKLNRKRNIHEQAVEFVKDIGLDARDETIIRAFEVACDIDKLTYANLAVEMNKRYGGGHYLIMQDLKGSFAVWLYVHHNIKDHCPKMTLIQVINIFVSKVC